METSTLPVLRPLRLGELLDQAIRLYRRNFLTFVGIIALVYIPYVLLQTISSTLYLNSLQTLRNAREILTSPAYWLFLATFFIASVIYTVFVSGLGTAALTNAVAHAYLGQKIGILDAYRKIGRSWIHLLLALIVLGLLSLLSFLWTLIPVVGWFTGLGLMIFLGGMVAELLPAVVIIEKSKGLAPISRAWNLARRRFWWLLGFSLIFVMFNLLIVTGPTLLVEALSNSLLGGRDVGNSAIITTLLSNILGGLLRLFTLPILTTAWTLVYFDLRVRTEGFDLALATLEPAENMQVDISNLPIPAADEKWLTGADVSKFAVISLTLFGIIALISGVLAAILVLARSAAVP